MSLFGCCIPLDQSDELRHVGDAVDRIMRQFDASYWRECDEKRAFADAFFHTMAEAGYLGSLIPRELGGLGLGPEVASVVVERINCAGGDASTVNAQMSICGVLVREGTPEQRAHLPHIADGSVRLLSVAATEPDSGADMSQLDSVAVRSGNDWVITAKKVFVSMAQHTDLFVLLVRTTEGPTLFLLDRRRLGDQIEIRPVQMITNRLTTMLFIDELPVADSCRVGPVGGGLACLMKGFAVRRVLAASESIGNARFFLSRSVQHASQRRTFNRLIGQNQGVQYPIAQAYTKLEGADLMRWDALRYMQHGKHAHARAALAKILASEAAWESARAALTAFGGWGLASEVHVERKLRDATIFVFNNMLLSYVAERVLGLPKAF